MSFLRNVLNSRSSNGNRDLGIYLTLFISTFFFLVFSAYSIYRYVSLNATGFDLGIYSSALFNALHGGLFYTNLLNESYLGNHFSPFMFLLVPFVYIYQHNATLLVLQAFFISFGAVPIYLTFRKVVPEDYRKYGFSLVVLYELSPVVIGPISFDFHLMALMPFFYLFALYFFVARKMIPFYLSIAAIVSIHAFFALIAVFFIFSLYLARYVRKGWLAEMTHRKMEALRIFAGFIVAVVILIAYLLFAEHMKSVISGSSFSITGINSLFIYLKNEYNISFTTGMLMHMFGSKLSILAVALIGGGIFAILSPLYLIPVVPYLVFAMFSGNAAYYTEGYQYTAMFSSMIFAGAIFGLKRIMKSFGGVRSPIMKFRTFVVFLVLALAIFGFVLSPISPEPYHIQDGNIASFSEFHVNQTSEAVYLLRNNINRSSLILTQNNLYPQFSKYPDAYLLYSYTAIGNLSSLIQRNFTYIIADRYSFFYNQADLVGISMKGLVEKLSLSGYGTYFNESGIVVLKYKYSGPQYVIENGSLVLE